ncbi:SDR family oxidoreductase [Nesterenkonia ebinurensis]|uniref:SDR family oxidoreductase n=1 Tax=Nesterenkonia ebinurensis TaxID=2608252 RepID=UPI00168AB3D0|nr:NAD-dependent epimerase/dehydratase family protein [Nesterenkonia ebinurensis]
MRIVVIGGTGVAGSAVMRQGQRRKHEMTAVSRASGVDVLRGTGLEEAMATADAVIDVSSIRTLSQRRATQFFRTAMTNILATATHVELPHLVRLSIIGVDQNPRGFYAGQLALEQMCGDSAVPSTVLRAAQFHEFAAQTLQRGAVGPLVLAPRARVQPIAAKEVGARLIELAENGPQGRVRDLAGPREEELGEMARDYARRTGRGGPVVSVSLPMAMMRGMRQGLNLPGSHADLGVQTFAEWLRELP